MGKVISEENDTVCWSFSLRYSAMIAARTAANAVSTGHFDRITLGLSVESGFQITFVPGTSESVYLFLVS
jgi:hypothetical protein